MGYWLITGAENSKEFESSRYTEWLLPVGLSLSLALVLRTRWLTARGPCGVMLVAPYGNGPVELARSHCERGRAPHGEMSPRGPPLQNRRGGGAGEAARWPVLPACACCGPGRRSGGPCRSWAPRGGRRPLWSSTLK